MLFFLPLLAGLTRFSRLLLKIGSPWPLTLLGPMFLGSFGILFWYLGFLLFRFTMRLSLRIRHKSPRGSNPSQRPVLKPNLACLSFSQCKPCAAEPASIPEGRSRLPRRGLGFDLSDREPRGCEGNGRVGIGRSAAARQWTEKDRDGLGGAGSRKIRRRSGFFLSAQAGFRALTRRRKARLTVLLRTSL